MTDTVPVTAGVLDAWTLGLAPEDVGPALVGLGTTPAQLARWPARDPRRPVFLPWTPPDPGAAHDPAHGSGRDPG